MPKPKFLGVAEKIAATLSCKLQGDHWAGAFKGVYRLLVNGESWALKIMKASHQNHRLQREIEAILSCNHSNIAKLSHYDSIIYNGNSYIYYLEEFIEGGTLESEIEFGICKRDRIMFIGRSMASALQHLHCKHLVHRDIKPANIMVRPTGEIVLVDFGLVRNLVETSLTASWLSMGPGTPLFASPEQWNNDKQMIDWRSDQFSLGVLLTLGLTGLHPYQNSESEQSTDYLGRVAAREAPSSRFKDYVSDQKLYQLAKMVSPWPINRYRLPTDLIIDLNQVVD